MKERITGGDNLMSAIVKLAEGNPGAATAMADICSSAAAIDPDAAFMEWAPLFAFDTAGIYGDRIWMLYKDVCNFSVVGTLTLLRAVQMGLLSQKKLDYAIDNRGSGIDLEAALTAVRGRLPKFAEGRSLNEHETTA